MRESFPEEKGILDGGRCKTKGREMGPATIHSRIGEKDGGWTRRGRREARKGNGARPQGLHGPVGHGQTLGRPHADLMSFQAADQLGPTQLVKILTQETPELLLEEGSAKVAQLIVLEVFATNEAHRPFFTLGIVSSTVCSMSSNLAEPPVRYSCSPLSLC